MIELGYEGLRAFLKDSIRQEVDFSHTDQVRGKEPPHIEKPAPEGAHMVSLPSIDELGDIGRIPLLDAIANRHSRRNFKEAPITRNELSWLLWSTQGVVRRLNSGTAFRTVPSAGCRHAFETYLCVFMVEGVDEGIYRYLPLSHELVAVSKPENLGLKLTNATLGQDFAARSAVTFAWTVMPYRMEWRYAEASHKVIALDAGHVCQNLYLAVEAIGCGTCAMGAYHQEGMDALLGVDGNDEFTIYLAPVGRV